MQRGSYGYNLHACIFAEKSPITYAIRLGLGLGVKIIMYALPK
jgi:hypothetical protein